ncbi:hypothetical protein [Agromyces sp. MMS17-SY077]|uniref:Uncharacterized protein n=1 Tax=Agromyces seonyuensis TaxID=2662446 RepID=A0A6I4NSY9_9MICO|nr:hypothetical protein [Agromyces seonyuensis]
MDHVQARDPDGRHAECFPQLRDKRRHLHARLGDLRIDLCRGRILQLLEPVQRERQLLTAGVELLSGDLVAVVDGFDEVVPLVTRERRDAEQVGRDDVLGLVRV